MIARASVLLAAAALFAPLSAMCGGEGSTVRPKYVFLFIGDGMSVPQRMTANEFSIATGGSGLRMNSMEIVAMARSRSANYLVTDSAAAATAIACGEKTNNGSLGVDKTGGKLISCAELAKMSGRRVGIITTVTITHATPAGFYAHRKTRGDVPNIARDLADSGFDFFAGGGIPLKGEKAKAADDYIAEKGYRMVKTADEFGSLRPGCGKVLARFSDDALANSIDAEEAAGQPTLPQMLKKAIELLDGDEGFFIMCEGGRIDWSCHGNDAATNMRDILALDDAVGVALDFEKAHPGEALVVVTGDHETGGMTMGFAGTGRDIHVERLGLQTMSTTAFNGRVARLFAERKGELAFDDVVPLMEKAFGVKFSGDPKKDPMRLSEQEEKDIRKAFDEDIAKYRKKVAETTDYKAPLRYVLGNALRTVVSHKAGVDWTSGSHTALPVMTTATGAGAKTLSGFYENSELGKRLRAFYE